MNMIMKLDDLNIIEQVKGGLWPKGVWVQGYFFDVICYGYTESVFNEIVFYSVIIIMFINYGEFT
jgi:hypothetical protein